MLKRTLFVIFGLNTVCTALLFGLLFAARCAFAQDTVSLAAPAGAELLGNPVAALREFIVEVKSGQLWYAAAALLFAVVGFLRAAGRKLHAFIPDDTTQPVLRLVEDVLTFVYDSKLGGWVLNWATTIAGCLASMKLAGLPVDAEAWRAALAASTTGTAAIELWDDLKEWWPTSKLRAWLASAPKVPPAAALVLLLPLFALSGCTATQAFAVTGDSIKATGRQYVDTSEAMIKAVDQGKITPAQFRSWVAFSDKFELTWDTAAAAWLRARAAKQQVEQGQIEVAIAGIGADLFVFYLKVRDLGLLPPNLATAGAP